MKKPHWKKKNPHQIPATRADVDKARRIAKEEAADAAMAIMMTALMDKMGRTTEQVLELWGHVQEVSESIREGRITVPDLKDVLKQEAGIIVR